MTLLSFVGRVYSIRTAGSKLMFLDIVQDGSRLQVICNIGKLDGSQHIVPFKLFRRVVKRGDIIGRFPKVMPCSLLTIYRMCRTSIHN